MLKNSLIEHIFYSCRGCVSVMILHLSFLNSHCSLVYTWYCSKLVISIHTSIYFYFVIMEYFFWNLTWKMKWSNFELRLYVSKCRTSRALWLWDTVFCLYTCHCAQTKDCRVVVTNFLVATVWITSWMMRLFLMVLHLHRCFIQNNIKWTKMTSCNVSTFLPTQRETFIYFAVVTTQSLY